MTPVDLVGSAAAVLTTLCWAPQAVHILRSGTSEGVSLPAYLAFGAGIFLWLVYGLMLASWPLIGANAVTLALVLAIILVKLSHMRRAGKRPR